MDIIGVKNPYSLVQQAGRRKRTYRKKKVRRTFGKTRRYKK